MPEQFWIIRQMEEIYRNLVDHGYSRADALYFAYVQTHKNQFETSCGAGADTFRRDMTSLLRSAKDIIREVTKDYYWPMREPLQLHNTISLCLDPIRMFEIAIAGPTPRADPLEQRRDFEALRQFAIALQFYAIECADPEHEVAEDLFRIEELSWERLFIRGEGLTLWVINHMNPSKGYRSGKIEFFDKKKPATRRSKSLARKGVPHKVHIIPSRLVRIGKKELIVFAAERSKDLFSTLLKLERGRKAVDRRGWKYVIVGSRGTKKIKLATRTDAELFLEHTRTFLWQDPLFANPDDSEEVGNPYRDPTYWDKKIDGRFHHQNGERIIAGAAEQIVTTLRDYLDATTCHDRLNHTLYKADQIFDVITPIWFPRRRGPYQDNDRIRIPNYGINWELESVRQELESFWRTRI